MLKIISGAQTGVDRGALDAALELGIPRASQWRESHDIAHKIVSAVLRRLSGHERGTA